MIKIIVIQLKQIGDVLISASVLKNIKEMYPDSQVDYVVYDYTSGVVENAPYIDNIILISKEERNKPFKLYKRFFGMRKEKYDYVIDLIGDVKSALLTFFIGAKISIISKNKKIRNRIFYNRRIENNKKNVCEYRNFLISGIDNRNPLSHLIKIYLKDEERKELKNRMIENRIKFDKPVVALGANSRRIHRIWNIDYFAIIINHLIEKYNMQIILFNSSEEKVYAENLKSKINKKENVFVDIKTNNIRELASLMSNCDIFIGNEGGPRHIAESVGIPTFAIAYITHIKEDWILNNETWNTLNRMVQNKDCLKMSEIDFREYQKSIERNRKKEIKEFLKLTPDFVEGKIDEMIDYLRSSKVFREEIEWKSGELV